MKKNLTLLTVVVFIFASLAASGCDRGTKQNSSQEEEKGSAEVADGSTELQEDSTVRIYLKEVEIDGSMHLEMYNKRKPECPIIDGLVSDVYPGYTVVFMKAQKSRVEEVTDIRLLEEVFTITEYQVEAVDVDEAKEVEYYILEIDPDAPYDKIVKYEIDFKVKGDDTTWTIDPYLRIPPQSGGNGDTL